MSDSRSVVPQPARDSQDGALVSGERGVGDEQQHEARGGVVAGRAREGSFGVRGTGDTSGSGGLRLPGYTPVAAERPYGGWFDQVTDALLAGLAANGVAEAISQVVIDRGEITYYLRTETVAQVCQVLRDDVALRFELCSSVSGVDYGFTSGGLHGDEPVPQRLHVVYHLTSMTFRHRIRLEVAVDVPGDGGMNEHPHVPSVVAVYPTADWQEREVWDMFGIVFDGHPGLTRILMPDDWAGHPQRKDYPVGGIPIEYKGAEIPPPEQRRVYS
ncbi:MAG: NADH-quinone oxidoreductase subunit C [Mycobacteriaceae bacterium]